jgi:hypothetical protein
LQPARDHSPQAPARQSAQESTDKPAVAPPQQAAIAARPEAETPAAGDAAPAQAAAFSGTVNQPSAAPARQTASTDKPEPEAPAAANATPAQASAFSGTFNKPSPFASAPRPEAADPKQTATDTAKPYKAPSAPLGSAPIPGIGGASHKAETPEKAQLDSMPLPDLGKADDVDEAPAKPATAPLGSAPIPSVVPPRPAVDIELTGNIDVSSVAELDGDKGDDLPDFESTIIIPPDATLSNKQATNSTGAFIDRVKEQLSASETSADEKDDAFIQTTRL